MMSNTAFQQVECDDCGLRYDLSKHISIINRGPDIEVTVICCPGCGRETVAYQTDTEIRELQQKVRSERERANKKIRKGVPANKAERKLRQVKRALQEKMKELNNGR